MTLPPTLPKIAYNTGDYPRATDTFVWREVAALRALGAEVVTSTIQRTGAEHHVGEEQVAEAAATFHVKEAALNPLRLLRDHAKLLAQSPRRYLSALTLARHTAPPGIKNAMMQAAYFAEGGVLARHLQREGVRHLHNHFANSSCSVAMLASALSDIPYSVTMHGPSIFYEPGKWRIDEKIARARFVACISHFARSQAMNFSAQEHWRKLHIVHCAVHPGMYDRPREAGEGTRLLFVGRLAAVKGLPVLIEAMGTATRGTPDLHLTLIGDGADRAALERQVEAAGLSAHVTFAGYKSQAEVADALTRTDVFVLPSFAEGVPVVLMEALAARVPVIATRVAGVGELVEDGVSGLTVPPGDAGSLADAIARLAKDQALRARMGEAGRAKVEAEYDQQAEAAWLLSLITAPEEERPGLRPEADPKTPRAIAAE